MGDGEMGRRGGEQGSGKRRRSRGGRGGRTGERRRRTGNLSSLLQNAEKSCPQSRSHSDPVQSNILLKLSLTFYLMIKQTRQTDGKGKKYLRSDIVGSQRTEKQLQILGSGQP